MKTGCYLELLIPETMKATKYENGGNEPRL